MLRQRFSSLKHSSVRFDDRRPRCDKNGCRPDYRRNGIHPQFAAGGACGTSEREAKSRMTDARAASGQGDSRPPANRREGDGDAREAAGCGCTIDGQRILAKSRPIDATPRVCLPHILSNARTPGPFPARGRLAPRLAPGSHPTTSPPQASALLPIRDCLRSRPSRTRCRRRRRLCPPSPNTL